MKLSRRSTGMKGLWLALALGAGLVGCAVLTVDVDVYKGALVNEEHVQLHQLVALATAAKPLLIQLRDNLEWPYTNGMPIAKEEKEDPKDKTEEKTTDVNDKVNESAACGKVKDWYQPQYVELPKGHISEVKSQSVFRKTWDGIAEFFSGPPASCQLHFDSPYARSVNIILSLYEDLSSPDLDLYARKLKNANERLRKAQATFALKEDDQARFKHIRPGLSKLEDKDALKPLLDAYMAILIPSEKQTKKPIRDVETFITVFRKLALKDVNPENPNEENSKLQRGGGIEDELIHNWKPLIEASGDKLTERQNNTKRLAVRVAWKFLGEGQQNKLLSNLTKGLCVEGNTGKQACQELQEWTKELADAYWDSRQAVRELWEESLGLLIRIERLQRKNPDSYHGLKRKVIRLAVEVSSRSQIGLALNRLGNDGTCSSMKDVLSKEWTGICDGNPKGTTWTLKRIADNRESLTQALSSASTETALFLLHLDSLEKHALTEDSEIKDLVQKANRINPTRVVRLGLNRNFFDVIELNDELSDPQEVYRVVEEVSQNLANGFGRGRLAEGLHTLTEKYLELHNGKPNGADSDQQDRLLESLVEFAQKILFLANHEGLASPPGSDGLIVGGGKNILRGLLGDQIIEIYDRSQVFGSPHVPSATTRRYVRVLQAIGNSILFSANELRERERYREEGQKRVAAEVAAARSVYSPDPAKVITDLLAELEHDKQAAQTALDAAQAKEPSVAEQLQTLTDRRATGAQNLDAIKAKIGIYETKFAPVEKTYQVLLQHVSSETKSQWKTAWKETESELKAFLENDSESLEKKLSTARDLITSPASEKRSEFNDAISYVKSPDALSDFTKYRTDKSYDSKKRSKLLDEFIENIQELEKKRRAQVADYKKERDTQVGDLRRVNEAIAALTEEATQLSKLPHKIAQLETARTEIASVQGGVLKDTDGIKEAKGRIPFVSPETIYSLIRFHLEKKPTDSSQTAQTVLLSRIPPPGMPSPDPNDYKNPLEVMDTVIALLRHRQMEIVARFGKDSDEDKKATEALENAYRHRAGMIYIRPSSAYLRTSFPSTSLQDDPNLAWDNMLLKQGLRNLPFSSELRDILNPSVKQDQVLTSELDKQYWQNINRVRVSGAGFTNQALVKDDVGNWYVKQYFGDTERIWESAKNLALFSMSAKVPIDLAKQLSKATKPEEYAENSKETPTLQKVLEKHQGAYKTHTDEVLAKLERLHTKNDKSELQETMIAAWEAHDGIKKATSFKASLIGELKTEIRRWDEAAKALKDNANQDPGQVIVKDVRALSRLDTMLSASIAKMPPSDATDEVKQTAMKEVHKVVGGQVTDILTDQTRALDQYEQAIVFIGDAANPKETKEANSTSEPLTYKDIRK